QPQRPELCNLVSGRQHPTEHFRVAPLSDSTEVGARRYALREGLDLPSLYFPHPREVVDRGGVLLARSPYITLLDGETYTERTVRFRTVGDMTCTGAVESTADSVPAIIEEVAAARVTERGARADDRRAEAAMEDRKRRGY